MKLSRRSFLYGAGPVFWAQPALGAVKAIRFAENPIIRPDMPTVGNDINGPSLVSVPKWLANPLGRYYLYFAGHRGTYIRLAYADAMKGPWRIYEQGVLRLKDTVCHGHIASPDVHVDDAARQVRLYFHGPITDKPNPQRTFLAVSQDGQQFTASPEVLGLDYLRVFRWNSYYYGISNGAKLQRSKNPAAPFEPGPNLFPQWPEGRVRHVAVRLDGDVLSLFYTCIGDTPERILLSTVRLTPDWSQWRGSEGELVLQPEMLYEGADLPLEASKAGPAPGRVPQLRDPAIYREGGKTYLLYSVAGESGIAIAELRLT